MSFDSAKALKTATGRAKSDVANKLVSMFLHEISRRVSVAGGVQVSSPDYLRAVVNVFGHRCVYCNRDLEQDRAAVEHLDGMNRFRVGLHVPGNVAVSCRRCNNEKRRDDQKQTLTLASTGWESFLAHDGTRCPKGCKTCDYWTLVWQDERQKRHFLAESVKRVVKFRKGFARFIKWSDDARPAIQHRVEALYRTCQDFATSEIDKLTSELNFDFSDLKTNEVRG
ncbi:MAG: HNH endonuclease [Verrucomicrobiaceae bacterium]|jgi:hypothetical protein|nr:HNH endonuclease [Verrucomicrobiaceae bacterium]